MNAIHARSQLRYWPTLGETNPNCSMRLLSPKTASSCYGSSASVSVTSASKTSFARRYRRSGAFCPAKSGIRSARSREARRTAKRREEFHGNRVRKRRRNRFEIVGQAVAKSAREAAGERTRQDGVRSLRPQQCRPIFRRCVRFLAREKRRSDLDAGGAEHERRRDRPPVRDAAGGDHGNPHRIDDLWHEREEPRQARIGGPKKRRPVSAGFESRGDDHINP